MDDKQVTQGIKGIELLAGHAGFHFWYSNKVTSWHEGVGAVRDTTAMQSCRYFG